MEVVMHDMITYSSGLKVEVSQRGSEWIGLRFAFTFVTFIVALAAKGPAQTSSGLHNKAGLRMSVDAADHDPAIHVQIPGGAEAERSFNILIPEHVTVRARGSSDAKHLYIFEPGATPQPPHWVKSTNSLSYELDLGPVHFVARATLEEDGIRFRYEFENHSNVDYDMAWAVTDPRFKVFFYDPRLERTYVHQKSGFVLLASETPERLTLPLSKWLPARYHAQFTTPIPSQRVQHRDDGISYYYKSEPVDIPLIATLSVDGTWVAASFARDPGNVWSNPELTCQHVDPQVALPKQEKAYYEMKILMFKGSLDQALRKVEVQRPGLQESQAAK
jgi:hypothetical protein